MAGMTLDAYLQGREPQGFTSVPHYFADGDYVTFFQTNERCHEQRLDDLVTVYLSMTSGRMIGVKIKGIRRIVESLGGQGFVVSVTRRPITLSLLFLGAGVLLPSSKDEYQKLVQQFADPNLPCDDLALSA